MQAAKIQPNVPLPITLETIAASVGEKKPLLRDALIASGRLLELPITQRPKILGEWLREGDFGYLYAPRGHGKTWLAMMIGNAMATGQSLGSWQAGEKCPACRLLRCRDEPS
ncbi:MAG: AAA family ATPase [Akkermansiaceae bacterium]|nr:AAA family ATPase [Akkermansiaceae bacterium]